MALETYTQSDLEKTSKTNKTSKKEVGFTVTDIKQAVKNPNRANIYINGKYRLSLDIYQLTQLGVKIGAYFSKDELENLEQQSEFGKLYALALNYCLMRPHSKKEVADYLFKKTLDKKVRNRKTGEFYKKKGVSTLSVDQVMARLSEKGYLDDEKFTRFWVENRNVRKGTSIKKLRSELSVKGVSTSIIDDILSDSNRCDREEIIKIIEKKAKKYSDKNKFIAYLARQGFTYDDIKLALEECGLFNS